MTTEQPRTCHIHGIEVAYRQWCPLCMDAFETRQPAGEMSGNQRATEMEQWYGPLEVPFENLHQRIEELVGRPVWTHELAMNKDGLIAEAATRRHPTMDEIVELIPAEKRIIVVLPDEPRSKP